MTPAGRPRSPRKTRFARAIIAACDRHSITLRELARATSIPERTMQHYLSDASGITARRIAALERTLKLDQGSLGRLA
jgi:hypothetical protein